jgi:hypothetical protein
MKVHTDVAVMYMVPEGAMVGWMRITPSTILLGALLPELL